MQAALAASLSDRRANHLDLYQAASTVWRIGCSDEQPTTRRAKMRIATFNLENLGSRIGNADDFDRRLGILRPQLERLQADIVCLQEINAERTGPGRGRQLIALDRLLQDTAYGDFHRASTFHPATGYPADRHNLAILSRWPIETPAQYHHAFVLPPIHTFINAEPACSVAALDGRDDHRGAGHLN